MTVMPRRSESALCRDGKAGMSRIGGRSAVEVHRSDELCDVAWDAFLEASPGGEFQQSSMWARAKAGDGWKVERVVLREDHGNAIRGGFQILWRKSRAGRIGYVSRGPVLATEASESGTLLVDELKKAADRLKLVALITQCPAGGEILDSQLSQSGFLPNRIRSIVTATWVTPLAGGIDQVMAGMARETQKKLRQSVRRGVTVREGSADDLGIFFKLMIKTCQRQGVAPNPGSLEALQRVWDAFHPGGHIRVGIAFQAGRPVATQLALRFGGRISFWKKGSDPEYLNLHPVEPLYLDALDWGCREGDLIADFGSLKQATAETLLAGDLLTEEMKRSRDFYNMRFGGHPVLLPEARIYIRNGLLRALYRVTACSSLGSRLLRKRYVC
jgi:hypothetical protein